LRAVFFDLDGTLVDSAPDLIAAVQALCNELGAPPPDAVRVREVVPPPADARCCVADCRARTT
jgi:phosphoglycolate phosphatase